MSKFTAKARTKPSAPMQYLNKNNLLIGDCLDYGCGRGFDAAYYMMDKYDPYWFYEYLSKEYDTITCNYVLNVVGVEERYDIVEDVMKYLKPSGIAYFSVRRDYKKAYVGKDCTQSVVHMSDLKSIYKNNKFEIYAGGVSELQEQLYRLDLEIQTVDFLYQELYLGNPEVGENKEDIKATLREFGERV